MRPGWLPAVGALIPLHGSGHFLGGDSRTGWRLLSLQGIGLGATAAGFAPIVATGASRRVIGPSYALTLLGVSFFVLPGLADLYGSIFAGSPPGQPARTSDTLSAGLGYAYLYDPQFDTHHLNVVSADWRQGFWRVSGKGWLSLDEDHQRWRGETAYRFWGPSQGSGPLSRDGTALDVNLGLTYQRLGSEGFQILTPEVSLSGRLDLVRLGPSLAGAFAEMALGLGLELYGYPAAGLGLGEDVAELLLFRTAFGSYLGRPGTRWGEVAFFYNHRQDALVGSALGGVVGHVGLGGHFFLSEHWGAAAEVRLGAAYLATLNLVYRYAGEST